MGVIFLILVLLVLVPNALAAKPEAANFARMRTGLERLLSELEIGVSQADGFGLETILLIAAMCLPGVRELSPEYRSGISMYRCVYNG